MASVINEHKYELVNVALEKQYAHYFVKHREGERKDRQKYSSDVGHYIESLQNTGPDSLLNQKRLKGANDD